MDTCPKLELIRQGSIFSLFEISQNRFRSRNYRFLDTNSYKFHRRSLNPSAEIILSSDLPFLRHSSMNKKVQVLILKELTDTANQIHDLTWFFHSLSEAFVYFHDAKFENLSPIHWEDTTIRWYCGLSELLTSIHNIRRQWWFWPHVV